MATNAPFFLNAADLATATAVYLDISLTNIAPDGFYGDGTITREQASGVLLTSEACVSPCPTPCGDSISATGGTGVYKINLDVGSTETGAIIITFNPSSIPDGIRVTYNGNVYNKLSSPTTGVFKAATPFAYTIIGSSGSTGGCSSWYPAGGTITLPEYLYNSSTSSFDATGATQTNTIATGDFSILSTYWSDCKIVIPKPTTTPSGLLIEIIGPCASTGWDFSAECPAALPTFSSSNVSGSASIPCATSMPNTYYFAKVHTDLDSYVGRYDYVFTDVNGQYPLADGYYLTSNAGTTNKVLNVVNGVVSSITDCTSTPPAFSTTMTVGGNTQFGYREGVYGAISDTDISTPAGPSAVLKDLYWGGGTIGFFITNGSTTVPPDGWTTLTINGNSYNRSSFTYSYNSPTNRWTYSLVVPSNPFGTVIGATKSITLT